MDASAYAGPGILFGTELPKVGRAADWHARFGNAIVLLFLFSQCLDGIFTYVGVVTFGIGVEANPLVAGLMMHLGQGPGVAGAKVFAGVLGIGLHLYGIHVAVALLTGFYFTVAVAPWAMLLFF
jgi:hypothetical protein